MNKTMKSIINCSLRGIGMALFISAMGLMIADLAEGGNTPMENYRLSKTVIGSILCGIAWGAPAVLYEKDNLSMPMKFLIHFAIGGIVYVAVALWAGWMGTDTSLGQKFLILAIALGLALLIWTVSYLRYKREVRRMNERIREMQ